MSARTIGRIARVCPRGRRPIRLYELVVGRFSLARASMPSERSTPTSRGARGDEGTAEPGATADVEHVELLRPARPASSGRGDERRRAVGQPLELGLEVAAKLSNVGSMYSAAARAGTSSPLQAAHVARNGIGRRLLEPLVVDADGGAGVAEHAVRHRHQAARLAMPRAKGDGPAEALGGFLRPAQPVQQDAEIGVGVGVFRVEAMAARYDASASTGRPVARRSTPRLLWAFAWPDRARSAGVRVDRPVRRPEDCRMMPRLL